MQGLCRLSRRWHQQFCHSPSFGHHHQCLPTFVPTRGLRQARKQVKSRESILEPHQFQPLRHRNDIEHLSPSRQLDREDDDLVVREFEQHGTDPSTRREIQPDAALSSDVDDVWKELQEIERQLKIARQGPLGPQSEFMQQLPAEEREELLRALASEGYVPQDADDALDLAEIDRIFEEDEMDPDAEEDAEVDEPLALTLAVPRGDQALVARFNKALADAKEHEEDLLKSVTLWKWYLRCQQKIPAFSRYMSHNVWDFLWASQERLKVKPDHLVILGQEMTAVRAAMSPQQCLGYVKALFASNHAADALEVWEQIEQDEILRDEPAMMLDFYSIGIRVYASIGDVAKAHAIAFSAIQQGLDPRILVQVVIAWAKDKNPGSAAKSWSVYLKLLSLLGDKTSPGLFEEISNAMLDTKHNTMALAVFKDMIDRMRGSGSGTLAAYEKALGAVKANNDPQVVENAINQVSLKMLLALPKHYQNKYFFASWIKKLLGEQRTEAAAMIVDLMYERGIKPDAIHLNGLIGAWLRENSRQSCERAEHLAYEMIQVKVNQAAEVTPRNGLQDLQNLFRKTFPRRDITALQPVHIDRPIPAANQETFALLFDYYESRRQWDKIQSLTHTMIGPTQLRPNTFIMNKLLAVELHHSSLDRFWTIYGGLRQQISPNIETFGLVWQATSLEAKRARNTSVSKHRQQFASLMDWFHGAPSRVRSSAKRDFDEAFYVEITKSFCFQLDLAGMICAIQGLFQTFGYAPGDTAVQLISGQAARALPRDPEDSGERQSGRRRANTKLAPDQTKLKKIANIIETLEVERAFELVNQHGVDSVTLHDESSVEHKELRVDVMTKFLKLMMQNIGKESAHGTGKTLRDVARVMHVDISHVATDG